MFMTGHPTYASRHTSHFEIEDIKYADLIVIGRVSNYRIIRDLEFRKSMLANPNLASGLRLHYENPNTSLLSDYAVFNVEISEIIKGAAPNKIAVTWENSTFSDPALLESGPYLIALRDPQSTIPPLWGSSATIWPNKEPERLTPRHSSFHIPILALRAS